MREVKRTAMLLASIILGTTLLVPALVVAQETTPSVPASETPAPPEESGPFGFWLKYDSVTDSRQLEGAPKTPERVNWVFLVSGVPPGTESHLWANFESGGTIETYGQSFLTVSTAGHDRLVSASSHSVVSNRAEAEGASLTLQSITFVGGEPEAAGKSTKDEPRQTSSKPRAAKQEAEPFLPYTGANDALLYCAAFFAIVGLGLRQVAH